MYKRIILYPDLSHALGNDDGKAEILQQVYYWTSLYSKNPEKYKNHFQDSAWWVYNSYPAWKENDFPNMSIKSIERKFVALREQGYLIRSTKNYNKIKFGKGKAKGENINDVSWYRINFEKLHAEIPMTKEIFPNINGQSDVTSTDNLSVGYGQSDVTSTDNLSVGYGQSDVTNTLEYPYTSTENKTNPSPYTENFDRNTDDEQQSTIGKADRGKGFINSDKKRNGSPLDIAQKIFETDEYYSHVSLGRRKLFLDFLGKYFEAYEQYRKEKHPNVSEKQMLKALDNIRICSAHEHPEIIPLYFQSEFKKGCDYRLSHFTSLGVLRARLKELANGTKANDTLSENIIDDEWCEYGEEEKLPFD